MLTISQTLTMPSQIQIAFLVEALLNIPGIVALTLFPSRTLKFFLATPLPSAELHGTTILLARALGVLILGLTPPLLIAYPNTKDAAGARRIVYWTLGIGEGGLIPLLLWEAFRASDEKKATENGTGGWSRKAALMGVASLLPLLLWRVYVFTVKPSWFAGDESSGGGKKMI